LPFGKTSLPSGRQKGGEAVKLVSWVDLQERWNHYTRRGLYKIRAWPDFPEPFAVVSRGKFPIWELADIVKLERARPELKSNDAKRRKVAGYGRARARGKKTTK